MVRYTTFLLLLLMPYGGSAALPQAGGAPERVEVTARQTSVDVHIGGRPFTVYYFDPSVAKPYFHPLQSAQGTVVTRGFPQTTDIGGEDRDEPHQRAMYFAHGDINGFDFWGEAAFPAWSDHPAATFGRTVFRSLDEAQSGPNGGRVGATFDLVAPTGTLGRERQRYRFFGDQQTRVIDCEFSILATERAIVIGDSKEGTFAIRLVKALRSPPGHMVNAEGATGEKGIWGKRSRWVDYYGRVGTEDVGVAVLDHPANFRAPTFWHARGYGLLAANPFGLKSFTHNRQQNGSYTIPAGGSLVLRYRVLIHHGDPVQAAVAEAFRSFATEK